MKQYIDKNALVAEIEALISNGKFKCQQSQENGDRESYIAWSEHIATCGKILSFINTLEVKEVEEVDLEKFGEIARHLIAIKEHTEDMRLYNEEWSMLEKIGYPERFKE